VRAFLIEGDRSALPEKKFRDGDEETERISERGRAKEEERDSPPLSRLSSSFALPLSLSSSFALPLSLILSVSSSFALPLSLILSSSFALPLREEGGERGRKVEGGR
jgi:hypothetical protein